MIEKEQRDSSERLVMFTDAVAAIALTLLILPLLETVAEVPSFDELIHDHKSQFGALVLSFAVIFRLWWSHHRLFRHISRLSGWLVAWSAVWTFAIVLLPIPTAVISAFHTSAGTVLFYGATLALSTAALAGIGLTVYRNPELSEGRTPLPRENVLINASFFVTQVIATIVGCVFPDINFYAFFLMFLTGPLERLLLSRWHTRSSA
ncbi:TMEM175 family protein [Actinoplanes sp. NPDC026619]|uniref:TMEM175 family protein n=1 Tax=Actinoplanes sp. NPDC026619 TaxID=3155798 RepID=UPI0033E42851